jgi:hypothetical protein
MIFEPSLYFGTPFASLGAVVHIMGTQCSDIEADINTTSIPWTDREMVLHHKPLMALSI